MSSTRFTSSSTPSTRSANLQRIAAPVSVHLEITEIADRVSKQPGGGKALLFEHPVLRDGTRSPMPVAINLFGSMKRMALALGRRRSRRHRRVALRQLMDLKVPDGLMGKLSMLPRLLEISKFPPRTKSGSGGMPGNRVAG